jgi:hypothetical protein
MKYLLLFKDLESLLTQLSRYFGKLIILILFWSSILSLAHLTANALGYSNLFSDLYSITFEIYGEKTAWASTSIALATSVAFGHMRNLEINEEKRLGEQKEKWEAEYKRKYSDTPTIKDQRNDLNKKLNS